MSNKLKLSYVLMAVGVTFMVGGVFLLAQPALVQAAGPDPINLTNEAGVLLPESPAAQADPGTGDYILPWPEAVAAIWVRPV